MKGKEAWKFALQIVSSIITAIITALSTTSCMGHGPIVF